MNLTNISLADEAFIRQKYLYWLDAADAQIVKYRYNISPHGIIEYNGVSKIVSKISRSDYLSQGEFIKDVSVNGVGMYQPQYLKKGTIGNDLPTLHCHEARDGTNAAIYMQSSMPRPADNSTEGDAFSLYNSPLGHFNHTLFLVMKAKLIENQNYKWYQGILSVGTYAGDSANRAFLFNAAKIGTYQIDMGASGKPSDSSPNGFRGRVRGIINARNMLDNPTSSTSNNSSNILEIVYNADSENMSLVTNGSTRYTENLLFRLAPSSRIRIFANRGSNGSFESEIGELIVINSIDSADRNYVREYLSTKWGISIA